MTTMRSAAKGLVEHRRERFQSRHSLEQSQRRLAAALAKAQVRGATRFTPEWATQDGVTILEARFDPSPRTQRILKASSIGMALLVAASAWAVVSREVNGSIAFLAPLFTVLVVLAFPFVALGLASGRDAEEARIRKAIGIALRDEEPGFPPAQRWADED